MVQPWLCLVGAERVSKSPEFAIPLPLCLRQFPRVSFFLSVASQKVILIQHSPRRNECHPRTDRRALAKPRLKLSRTDHERALCFGKVGDLSIRRDDRALAPELRGKPLNDLVGSLAFLGIHHLNAGAMFMVFCALTLPPAVEDYRDRMAFPLPIRHQITKEVFSRHLGLGPNLATFTE